MPRLDGTGPMGMGPMTGGGFGRCSAAAQSGSGAGQGFARRGMRLRQRFLRNNTLNVSAEGVPAENEILKNETESLKNRIEILENSLSEISAKINKTEQPE